MGCCVSGLNLQNNFKPNWAIALFGFSIYGAGALSDWSQKAGFRMGLDVDQPVFYLRFGGSPVSRYYTAAPGTVIKSFPNGAWLALGAAAVCFGLAHFGGGLKVRDPGHGGRVGVWNHLPAHRKHRSQHSDPLWPQHHPFYLFHLSSLGDGAELKARFRFLHLVQVVLGDGIVPICPCSILSASREAAKNAKGCF